MSSRFTHLRAGSCYPGIFSRREARRSTVPRVCNQLPRLPVDEAGLLVTFTEWQRL